MLNPNVWSLRAARRGLNLDVAPDEPSHIHIARPSRLRPQANAGVRIEPVDAVRDPAAPEVAVQAA